MLLPSGKLIGLLFYLLLLFLLSFLFLKPNVDTYKKLSRNELARLVMGTIFLVIYRMKRKANRTLTHPCVTKYTLLGFFPMNYQKFP